MSCAICETDARFCLLLLLLLLLPLTFLLLQRVLPLRSFSHLTKRHANHSLAGASLAAPESFNHCQSASYGRRLNQLLNSDRESARLKCILCLSGCEQPGRRQGEILIQEHLTSTLDYFRLVCLGLVYFVTLVRARSFARLV